MQWNLWNNSGSRVGVGEMPGLGWPAESALSKPCLATGHVRAPGITGPSTTVRRKALATLGQKSAEVQCTEKSLTEHHLTHHTLHQSCIPFSDL